MSPCQTSPSHSMTGCSHASQLLGIFSQVEPTLLICTVWFIQLHEAANVKSAVGFLQALIEAVPYTIHIVLTDNGIQFGDMPSRRTGPTARYRLHMFDRICREHGIEHRLTKPNIPGPTVRSSG